MLPPNLLGRAQRLTGVQTVQWFQNTNRATNDEGIDVSTYAEAEPIKASVQPIPARMLQFLGLEADKSFIMIYAQQAIGTAQRDVSGDKIVWNEGAYEVKSKDDWKAINGWNGIVAQYVGPA